MNALVIGGGGFLGTKIVEMLISDGHNVRVLGRNYYTHLKKMDVECIKADIRNEADIAKSLTGIDTIFHVASKNGFYGNWNEFKSINIVGTETILSAALSKNVEKFIYTSSPAVVGFDNDLHNGGIDVPYPTKHESPYSYTKAQAEQIVKTKNGDGIATVSLRPHMIFGPGDKHLFPRILDKASKGSFKRIGEGKNIIDLTFVDNAASAHIDAAKALISDKSPCAGGAYFISNDEPVIFYDYLNEIFRNLNINTINNGLTLSTARKVGKLLEGFYKTFSIKSEPLVTPYLANMMGLSHWYDMGPAKKDLNYKVKVSMSEGTKRTLEWLKNNRSFDKK